MDRFCSKSAGIKFRRRLYIAVLAALSNSAYALPQGGKVTVGDASIQDAGDSMNIHQDSQRVVLDFDSFSVDANETVNYIQPNSDSVALNRVLGSELSEIHGAINANGHVYLINPNGVLFGEGAQVNVGGLVATTLDIDNQSFINRHENFEGSSGASVVNKGHINASNRVVLMATDVLNSGDIQVPAGEIMLRSGNSVFLHSAGSEIPILVEDPQLSGGVVNEGSLSASRVALVLDGQEGRDIYEGAINNHGLVRAVSVTGEGGSIELLAASSDVINTGRLDARANNGDGGTVNIEAHRYAQTGELNASGANIGDGGFANIHAKDTIVLHTDSESHIDAGTQGNGGEMIVYADNATWYREGSEISARGGTIAGDGGFVEVSGRNVVAVESPVDIGANNGKGGLWYIDPTDITVQEGPANTNGDFVLNGDDYIFTLDLPEQATSTINNLSLQDTLVNFGNVYLDTASGAPGTGNITFDAMIDFIGIPAGRVMSLRADNDIVFRDGAGFTHTNNGNWSLNLEMNAGGSITFEAGAAVAFRGGSVNAIAVNDFSLLGDALIVGGGDININAGNDIVMAQDSLFNSGSFQTTLIAGNNVTLADITSTNTTDNAISITATAGQILDDGNAANGLHATEGGIFLQAVNGIESVALETSQLGIHNTVAGDVVLNNTGDLSLNRLALGSNMAMSISATGSLTYVGDASNDLDGTLASTLSLTSGNEMVINGRMADETGGSDHDLDINLVAGTDLLMLDGSVLSSGLGLFDVQVLSGDATITGLNTQAMVNNAITVSVLNGQILDGGDSRIDLNAPNGGFFLRSMGDIAGLESGTNTFDVISATGNIELSDIASFAAERIEAPGNVTINAANGLAIRDSVILNATDFTVNTSGFIRMPVGALSVTGTMTLNGSDIFQQNGLREVALNANTLLLNSGFVGGDVALNTNTQFLDLRNTGANTVTLTNAADLSLTHYAATTGSTIVETTPGFDLTVVNAIELDGNSAALTLNSGNTLWLNANISDLTGTVDNATQLSLLAEGSIQQLSMVNAGAGDLILNAGGDLNLGSVAGASAAITAGGNITDANDAVLNIAASIVSLSAGTDAGSVADALEISTNALTLGAGDAFVVNDGALALTIAAIDNINITLATGDLTLLDSLPNITGNSVFSVPGGSLIIPDAGWTSPGNLTLAAMDFIDSDRRLVLSATDADITLTAMAGNLTFNSVFNQLAFDAQTSTDTLTVNALNGIQIDALAVGGSASINANGNIRLTEAISVPGTLSVQTVGTGTLQIADAGLNTLGDWVFDVASLQDSDQNVIVSANTTALTLRNQLQPITLNTTFSQLDLSNATGSAITLQQTGDLSINSLNVGGDVNIDVDGNLNFLQSNPVVVGDLSLAVTDILAIADSGLNLVGNLTVNANTVVNGSGVGTTQWQAGAFTLNVTNSIQNNALQIDASNLNLTASGTNALSVALQNNTVISGLSTANDLTLNSLDDIQLLTSTAAVNGLFDIQTSGTVTLPDTGLTATALSLQANNLVSASGGAVGLTGESAILVLNGDQSLALTSELDTLDLTFAADNSLSINNTGNLLLSNWQAANATQVELTTSGVLQLPVNGIGASSRLSINAADIADGDKTFSFLAPELLVNLTNAQGEYAWQLSGGVVDTVLAGQAGLTIISDNALTLQDLNNDNQAVNISDGNFTVLLNDGDLNIESNITASDLSQDSERNGIIDLAVENGDIFVGQLGNVKILSSYNVGGLDSVDEGVQNGITLSLLDDTATERQIVLGNGSSTVELQTIGSDIELNAWPIATAQGALRNIVQAEGVQIEAYTLAGDAMTGRVILNGEVVTAEPWQQIQENRTLTIVTEKPPLPYEIEEVLGDMTDAGDSIVIEDELQVVADNVEYQFEAVFGNSCQEFDEHNAKRCRIDAALKAFLSHWLVGGELPPSSEI